MFHCAIFLSFYACCRSSFSVVEVEVCWQMGCRGPCRINLVAFRKDVTKQLDGISFGLFSQIVSEKHFLSALDQVLNDSFTAVVRKRDPINLRLSVPLKK